MRKLLLFSICIACLFSACFKSANVLPNGAIALTLDTLRLTQGSSTQLISKNYTATSLQWKSSDTTIATVSGGLVVAKKSGQTTILVNNPSNSVSATCIVIVSPPINTSETQIKGNGSDIGIGADGSVFVIGTDVSSTTGGFSIYKLVNNILVKMPNCAGIRIAVSPQGIPWVVNQSNLIFRYNGTTWDQLPGSATDIGIGADGSVFITSTTTVSPTGGFSIMKWNGTGWDTLTDCSGVHIAVSPQGIPWVVNKSNIVYQNSGGVLWYPVAGVSANDIGIGADGSVYVTGKDSTLASYAPPIFKFNSTTSGWSKLSGGLSGTSISVSPAGFAWWVDKQNNIYKQNN